MHRYVIFTQNAQSSQPAMRALACWPIACIQPASQPRACIMEGCSLRERDSDMAVSDPGGGGGAVCNGGAGVSSIIVATFVLSFRSHFLAEGLGLCRRQPIPRRRPKGFGLDFLPPTIPIYSWIVLKSN